MKLQTALATSGTLLGCLTTSTNAFSGSFFGDSSNLRQVKAAHRQRDLLKRENDIRRRHSLDMVFTEFENIDSSEPVFGTSVKVESDAPILNIEDFEHLLESVHCSEEGKRMELVFKHDDSLKMAKRELMEFENGMIITSHETCNMEGERKPYKLNMFNEKEGGCGLDMAVQPLSWKKAFQRYQIDFGYQQEGHIHRRQDSLLPRHLKPTAVKRDVATRLPSSKPTATSVTLDLSHHSGGSGSDFNFPIGPDVPFVVGCENCTTTGTLDLKQGAFDIQIDADSFDLDFDGNDKDNTTLSDFIKGGFVEMGFNDFTAHVLMHTIPNGGHEFTFDLFTVPTVSPLGFSIPGLGRAGLTFTPQLAASFNIQSSVKLLYGFNVQVPNDSKIRVDLSNWDKSEQTGFDQTKFEAIPFSVESNPPALTFAASLRPRIPLGFSFIDDQLVAEVGVFVDLPQLSTTISQVESADANCKPLPASELNSLQSFEKNLFKGNLTHIVNSVNLNLGVDAKLAAPALNVGPFSELTTAATLLSTAFPLPSACVSFDEKRTSLVPASQVLSSATATATAPGIGGNPPTGAAAAVRVPFGGHVGGYGVMDSLVGAVVFLAGLVVAL